MKLSDYLQYAQCECTLVTDGEFEALEQCTRIRGKQALTYLENPKYAYGLENPDISCVICTPEMKDQIPAHIQGVAISNTPKIAFFRIMNELVKTKEQKPTVIDPSATISPLAYVAPYDVVIGKNVVVGPFSVIQERTTLEDDVCVEAHCAIGSNGFLVVDINDEENFLVKDAGRTIIQKGVRVGPNCIIESGTLPFDKTVLGAYTMMASNVIIGHGSVVGKRCTLTGGVLIPGNCVIGDHVYFGLCSVLRNALTVGDHAKISMGAVVTKDVPAGEMVTGNLAINHQLFMRNFKESLKERE